MTASNLYAQEIFKGPQILHVEVRTQIIFERDYNSRIATRENNIIHTNKNIDLNRTLCM